MSNLPYFIFYLTKYWISCISLSIKICSFFCFAEVSYFMSLKLEYRILSSISRHLLSSVWYSHLASDLRHFLEEQSNGPHGTDCKSAISSLIQDGAEHNYFSEFPVIVCVGSTLDFPRGNIFRQLLYKLEDCYGTCHLAGLSSPSTRFHARWPVYMFLWRNSLVSRSDFSLIDVQCPQGTDPETNLGYLRKQH